ncbi:MAG: ADP-ribosylation factor-like protein [Candidatus Hodarchaeales archaeon]
MSDQATGDPDKIILIGLAESGKTTIIKVISEGYVPNRKEQYKATIDYKRKEITLLGQKLTLFDLGGQKVFLDRFTGELAQFVFSKVKSLVFVVDIEKVSQLSRAKYYLDLTVEKLNLYSPTAPIYVLLHKNDLVANEKMEEISKHLQTYLRSTLPKSIKFFETSVFSESIFHAFGDIFAEITGTRDTLARIISNFAKEEKTVGTIQLFYANGVPVIDIPDFKHVSLSQIRNVLDQALELIANNKEGVSSVFIESEKNVYIVRFLDNGTTLFLQFPQFEVYMSHESIPSIHNKAILLAKKIESFDSKY